MTIKKLIIVLVTIISLFPVILALVSSVNQPQVQSNLQLYQTNLILQASELSDSNDSEAVDLAPVKIALLGTNPYLTAKNQYQEVKKLTQENLDTLSTKLTKIPESNLNIDNNNVLTKSRLNSAKNFDQKEIKKQITQDERFLHKIDLSLGIIEAKQNNIEQSLQLWNGIIKSSDEQSIKTATVLTGLWNQPPEAITNTEQILNSQLKGWFRNEALKQYYQVTEQKQALISLQKQENEIATQAITKLTLVGGIPLISGLLGVGILVLLIIQLFLKGKSAILANNNELAWETPWNGEVIWLVLIVGFFFIGQIILPLFFGIIGSIFKLSVATLTLRYKAIYVLVSYLTMAITGLLVMYFSIKPFFPLPKDWFKFNWLSNWILWGIGGYFVAFPLVVIVSLINQQIWQGKGGSNPLLLLALESQDKIALSIFFITASLAAPLFEEIIFRGFLLPSLTRYFSVWGAIIVSSLIFALAHLNLSEVLPLATLGIVLGFVYTRSKNLLSSMLLHSLWNSGTLISLFILGSGNQ
ncbi:CPBP family intramembrane metalloprotease domain-containing protein [Aphanothece hegewaldii CCALA 016]|uniref:CPBP family intramembrane metalloprotease domain-containing protein n=1 Tax=Aphanothece hegewaldii CCALA 016 TaxID=2107694 RepID=A0A2T1LTL8_9CHRO|nr:CPBP family intramembrane glutamic endopeptidase [Aphanothece hegewaldii]PSF34249.1 CPBP family intramembrane metalloprotease domain-containing protein [Aphanothece hegewaldii CCALA 016]